MTVELDPALPLSIELRSGSPIPLHRQLTQQVAAAIDDGRLGAGERVEAIGALARRLRLSRNTVRFAYNTLVSCGYLSRDPRPIVIGVRPPRPANQ